VSSSFLVLVSLAFLGVKAAILAGLGGFCSFVFCGVFGVDLASELRRQFTTGVSPSKTRKAILGAPTIYP